MKMFSKIEEETHSIKIIHISHSFFLIFLIIKRASPSNVDYINILYCGG